MYRLRFVVRAADYVTDVGGLFVLRSRSSQLWDGHNDGHGNGAGTHGAVSTMETRENESSGHARRSRMRWLFGAGWLSWISYAGARCLRLPWFVRTGSADGMLGGPEMMPPTTHDPTDCLRDILALIKDEGFKGFMRAVKTDPLKWASKIACVLSEALSRLSPDRPVIGAESVTEEGTEPAPGPDPFEQMAIQVYDELPDKPAAEGLVGNFVMQLLAKKLWQALSEIIERAIAER